MEGGEHKWLTIKMNGKKVIKTKMTRTKSGRNAKTMAIPITKIQTVAA
jgi:hypothetical protein